jgi:putative flippase GtrA
LSQFIRYSLVQVASYGVDIGSFFLFLALLGDYPLPANAASKALGGVFCFLLHRAFTFRMPEENRDGAQAVRYFLLLAFNVPLSTAILGAILYVYVPEALAKIIGDGITFLINYWLNKRFVFVRRRVCDAARTLQ